MYGQRPPDGVQPPPHHNPYARGWGQAYGHSPNPQEMAAARMYGRGQPYGFGGPPPLGGSGTSPDQRQMYPPPHAYSQYYAQMPPTDMYGQRPPDGQPVHPHHNPYASHSLSNTGPSPVGGGGKSSPNSRPSPGSANSKQQDGNNSNSGSDDDEENDHRNHPDAQKWYHGSIPLGLEDDKYWLSELQVYLRSHFAEAFGATEEDIAGEY